jgi:hypothetical protein
VKNGSSRECEYVNNVSTQSLKKYGEPLGGCPRIASSRGQAKISRARRRGLKHRKRSCAYGEEVLVLLTQHVECAAARSTECSTELTPKPQHKSIVGQPPKVFM